MLLSHSSFPIVAVGAPATGLGATERFLRGLGDQPGVAVVVQIVDPGDESEAAAVLLQATRLPVVAALDDEPVEVDRVYLVPAGREMTIDCGILRLAPRCDGPAASPPAGASEDTRTKAAILVAEARDYTESIFEATRNCLVVLGAEGRVRSANRAFYEQFKMTAPEIEGLRLEDVGARQWDVPALRRLLDGLVDGAPRGEVRIEREFPGVGWRIVVASAHRVPRASVTLLTLVDLTESVRMEREIADYQSKLQKMAFQASLVEERERRRIAHHLHDHIGQSLALARMKLDAVRVAASGSPDVQTAIVAAIDLIAEAVTDTRSLTFELSPPILYDLGLKAALSWLSEEIERRAGIRVEILDDGRRPPFEDAIAALLFRVVRELLTNVFKHAETQTARVVLAHDGGDFVIDVEDAGVGFDPAAARRGTPGGFGLFSVREQLSRLGGTVTIDSGAGRGTQVRLRIPLMQRKPTPYPGMNLDEDPAGR